MLRPDRAHTLDWAFAMPVASAVAFLTPSPRLFSGPDGLARERDAPIERTAQRDRLR